MASHSDQWAVLVAGLGYGDEGKGSIVDFLVRKTGAKLVVRYNGGPQAAHRVVTDDGRSHIFSQFGSGTFVPGVATHLSGYMLVDPLALEKESDALRGVGVEDAFARITVSEDATVVTPYHQAANRLRELARGDERRGSCGMGVGEAIADARSKHGFSIRMRSLADPRKIVRILEGLRGYKLGQLQDVITSLRGTDAAQPEIDLLESASATDWIVERWAEIAKRFRIVSYEESNRIVRRQEGAVVFEGAQGALLDATYGFHPYVTSSDCSFKNAQSILRIADYGGEVVRVGVTRAYATRHGPGPFVTEDAELGKKLPDAKNGTNPWQREFRVGWIDGVALRYAAQIIGGVDAVALTCMDRVADMSLCKACSGYTVPKEGERYFHVSSGEPRIAESIVLHRSVDPESYHGFLGEILARAKPHYRMFDGSKHAKLFELVSVATGAPVGIMSMGETAKAKWLTEDGEKLFR